MGEDEPSPRNEARVDQDGPLVLRGRIRHSVQQGQPPDEYTQVSLCRCGASGNKPFCDGSHGRIGFADPGRCASPPEPAAQSAEGELVLKPIANGPLRIDGWFELTTADGQRWVCGDKTWLCRCGASGNKPFCDGTHKRTGFTA
jgi:CDGSH-type Zn-finger protein